MKTVDDVLDGIRNSGPRSILSDIRARAAAAADLLDVVKYLPQEDAKKALRTDAEKSHEQYPQYAGHWDNHKIGRVTRTVKTKMGLAFEKGDLCLYAEDIIDGKACRTAYSNRNGSDTIVRPSYIEAL